jgi:hypothetical protein
MYLTLKWSSLESTQTLTLNILLDIIHHLVYSKNSQVSIKKHNVSGTGICPRLQVKPTQLNPIDRASPYLRTTMPISEGTQTLVYIVNPPQSWSLHSCKLTCVECAYDETIIQWKNGVSVVAWWNTWSERLCVWEYTQKLWNNNILYIISSSYGAVTQIQI